MVLENLIVDPIVEGKRERERILQFSKSTFISTLTRDKRSVLTRCARVTSRAESFPISRNFSLFFDSSSEKRGKGIEEVEPRDPTWHTRPILAVTLSGKFGGEG